MIPIDTPIAIGENFWNIRGDFKVLLVANVGTHMSLIRLESGNFVIIDTIKMSDNLKAAINSLTDNGTKIEAVVGVHPFHISYFEEFYKEYPNAHYYGTPRHLRKITTIPWTGSLCDGAARSRWFPQIDIRIPAGAEFVDPQPEFMNHFTCAWVYHRQSGTIHVDDTISYADDPGVMSKLMGQKKGSISFHPTMKGPGLFPNPESPFQFRDWVRCLLQEWNIVNICTAHGGNRIGGGAEVLSNALLEHEPVFEKLSRKKASGKHKEFKPPLDGSICECG
ncbi:metal-dependent hydrolase [Acrasis kona]|uniref:Metal-dependent hydrolase n=1 Tax=Acrasis kona TaxID=1008807 RepID=A0AAW2ZCF5_9EUKA